MKSLVVLAVAFALAACSSVAGPEQAACPATQADGTAVSVSAGLQCDPVVDRLRQ